MIGIAIKLEDRLVKTLNLLKTELETARVQQKINKQVEVSHRVMNERIQKRNMWIGKCFQCATKILFKRTIEIY
jgi:ATP-dependent Lon protease